MCRFINKKVSFSGNSAHYNRDLVNTHFPTFSHLKLVEFNDDSTVSVYHYGIIGDNELDEIKLLGYFLEETMVIVGYNYTDDRPVVVIVTQDKVLFSDATIEIASTHHVITENVKDIPFFKTNWKSHPSITPHSFNRLPKIIRIIEENIQWDFGDTP